MSFKYSIPKRQNAGQVYNQEQLYIEYHPIIMKLLMVKGRGIMDAEDIAHDTFVYLFEIWDNIKWEQIENLLSLVLYQSVVRYYRQFGSNDNITGSSSFMELVDSETVRDPLDFVTMDCFRRTLQNAMNELSPAERAAFFGFYLEDKSVEELLQGRKKGTFYVQLLNARTKVSAFFEQNYVKD